MCSGRVDLDFIFKAFANGQDGVLIGGCKLNDCNYVTHGNFDALGNTYIAKNILERIGLNPERLAIEFMSGGEGNRLAEVVNEFTEKVKEIGPLGVAEGIETAGLRGTLEAVRKLIPYLRLVEREKLRVPVRTEEAYHEFYRSDDVRRMFDELVGDNLTISRIVSLLREKPLSTSEISQILGLNPSEVAKHMNNSSRQGLVRYDTNINRYALAR
jgi:coenzyme F420-reducing hydrogenase delta subunit